MTNNRLLDNSDKLSNINYGIILNKIKGNKKQQVEYDEVKQQSQKFIEMVEGYKSEYNDLVAKYEDTKKDYEKYKEETSTDLNIELEELNKKKEKYANLIKEYTAKLENN